MTANGPLKLAVRAAIKAGGGIKNAAHVCGVSETQAGRWNCLTDHDLPKREHLAPLDELALAGGGRAVILEQLARDLGHGVFPLPEGYGASEQVTVQLHVAGARFGEIAQVLVDALGDGELCHQERGEIAHKVDQALSALVHLRALVIDDETELGAGRPGVRAA